MSGDAETDGEVYRGHEGVTALMSCVIDEDDWCDDVHACWASLTPTNISDVIVIEKGEVNDRWGAGKKRQENLPQSKALKSPTDKDCPYQASVAGGGKEALVRSQGEPVRGRLPGSMTLGNPLPVPGRRPAGPLTLQFSLWSPGGQQLVANINVTSRDVKEIVGFFWCWVVWGADLWSVWPAVDDRQPLKVQLKLFKL